MVGDRLLVKVDLGLRTWLDNEVAGRVFHYTLAMASSVCTARRRPLHLLSSRDILKFDKRTYVKYGVRHLRRRFR